MRYFIGLTVPEGLAKEITELRRWFGVPGENQIQKCEPHITLVIPFETKLVEDEISKIIRSKIYKIEPFLLNTTHFGSFFDRVWYLGVEPHKPLEKLANTLKAALSSEINNQPLPFHPHITIVSRLYPCEFEEGEKILEWANITPATWSVDKITLFRFENHHWERAQTLSLSQNSV